MEMLMKPKETSIKPAKKIKCHLKHLSQFLDKLLKITTTWRNATAFLPIHGFHIHLTDTTQILKDGP